MDIRQPIPNTISSEPPPFDFDAEDDEMPDWCIEEAAHDGAMAAAHYWALREQGVPRKDARRFTIEWMDLRAE